MGSPINDLRPPTKLRVRHSFSTKFISTLNNQLTDEHRSVISKTPFGWFLDLSREVRLGRNILSELVVKWVDSSASFLIGGKLLPMNEKDFCIGLGLSTDGKDFNLKENWQRSSCVKYVGKETRDLDLVYKCLMTKRTKKIPCSDFCSLYVLVGICELLFPNRTGRVFPILFEIVDNLSRLGSYCWGSLVYRYLVRSLCKASDGLKKGKGTSNIYVDGCTYMLQVWFCEKFIPPKGQIDKYPRILHWMNIKLGDNVVKTALDNGVVVDDVDVDVDVGTMKDKKDDQGRQKMKDDQASPNKLLKKKLKESVMRTIEHQQHLVLQLKRKVVVLEQEIAEEEARRRRPEDGGQSVPRDGHSVEREEASISPGGMSSDPSPMKTYVRKGSRRRYKSIALRTPFTPLIKIQNERQ